MNTSYTPACPLGFNEDRKNPHIPFYFSWDELAMFTSTGIITNSEGKTFYIPDEKSEKPLFTYKGNFGTRRSNTNFTGERSPYVAVDIDIDEKASAVHKYALTDEQKVKAAADINTLLNELSGGKRDFFFCKRTSSGCGLHIIINLVDVPEGKFDLYEKEIFSVFAHKLKEIKPLLNYHYSVDAAMLTKSQGLHVNKDPHVIYTPARSTSASMYNLTPEYGEEGKDTDQKIYPTRLPHEIDRRMFARFEQFCSKEHVRLRQPDLFRLSLIFFQLWPDAALHDLIEKCAGFNEERAKDKHESNADFFRNGYKNFKNALGKTYAGKKITPDSLYYIMHQFGYTYHSDMELHFTGYLSSIKESVYEVFKKNDYVLLEAPTGGGKTNLMFGYLKQMARLHPDKNFVLALPYIGMAEQFRNENSDEEFEIKLLTGDRVEHISTLVEVPVVKPISVTNIPPVFELEKPGVEGIVMRPKGTKMPKNRKKKKVKAKKLGEKKTLEIDSHSIFDLPLPIVKHNNLWCTTYDSAASIKNIHTLVIDEAHDIVKQYEFRPDAIDKLESIRCKKKILITATPDILLPETENCFYLRCLKDDARKPSLSIEKVIGSLLPATKKNIVGKDSTLTFWNDKQKGEALSAALLTDGLLAELYNSDTRKKPHQKVLKMMGKLRPHAIATSYIGEGINVLNKSMDCINVVDDYDVDNIRQVSARPRQAHPEIRVILQETEYNPGGSWWFSRVHMCIQEVNRLMNIAAKLTEINKTLRYTIRAGDNLYAGFQDDEPFLRWNKWHEIFEVNINMVKADVAERYKHWLYHKQRPTWLLFMKKHFEVHENIIVTKNEEKDGKHIPKSFETFMKAGHDMIMIFHNYRKRNKDKRYKKEVYSPEMQKWSKENNHIETSADWQRWTGRYIKMLEYGAVDYETIESGQAFGYWQRKADMYVSVSEPILNDNDSAKEVRIADSNKAVVDYLLSLDFKSDRITKPKLFEMVELHVRRLGLKPIRKKMRTYFAALKSVAEIKTTRNKITGERYVRMVIDRRGTGKLSTGKVERAAKNAVDDPKYAGLLGKDLKRV